MKKTIIALITIAFLSCSTNTKLTISWTQQNFQPKKYNKVGVAVLLPSESTRLVVEESLAKEFNSAGINSAITFYAFPLAGKKDIIKDLNFEPGELKKIVVDKVHANNFDALLIVSLLDTKKEERYQQKSVAITPYYNPNYAAYNYNYYDYYSYIYYATYNQTYYTTETTYFIETNLYDVESEKLIWTAQSETKNMNSVEQEALKFAEIIVSDILSKNVLIK